VALKFQTEQYDFLKTRVELNGILDPHARAGTLGCILNYCQLIESKSKKKEDYAEYERRIKENLEILHETGFFPLLFLEV